MQYVSLYSDITDNMTSTNQHTGVRRSPRIIAKQLMEENTRLMEQNELLMEENTRLRAERYNGLEFVDEFMSQGLFRIDQVNLNWLKNKAIDRVWGEHAGTTNLPGYNTTNTDGTSRATDDKLKPIATDLAGDLEDAFCRGTASDQIATAGFIIEDTIERVVQLYKD